MKKLFTILCLLWSTGLFAQNTDDSYKVMFYNVENLFDTYDDTLIKDEEFLPEGDRFWSKYKYYQKINNIYKVIIALGEWSPPAIVALSEIENKKVLTDLVNNTPLVKYEYKIIHYNSPDRRGIDVAFLYREDLFEPISSKAIPIHFPKNPDSKTRDILHVKGIANQSDTLHVFVNHWPSRWGGQLESEERRLFVASVLKQKVDSLFNKDTESNIIITGDFNDYPNNKSISQILEAKQEFNEVNSTYLYNLSDYLFKDKNIGSHKYQGAWGVLDQFIVSGNLLMKNNSISTSVDDIYIFNADFLLEPDEGYYGFKPYRTFIGYKYQGGFSDHLPIYLILNFTK